MGSEHEEVMRDLRLALARQADRIAELDRCRTELAEDNAMLRETMKQAGLAAFFKGGGQPVDVGDHLRRVLASYTDRIAELEAERGRLRLVIAETASALGYTEADGSDVKPTADCDDCLCDWLDEHHPARGALLRAMLEALDAE